MTENIGNKVTCYLVHEDSKRDYSAVEDFGKLKVIFSSIDKSFDPHATIAHVRRTLAKFQQDDYIVLSGDPALCAICVTVVVEMYGYCNIMRWDRKLLNYTTMKLNFD